MDQAREGLSSAEVERFVRDGFVRVASAVSPELVAAGQAVLWSELGPPPEPGSAWDEPVRRILPSNPGPFAAAFASPRLQVCLDQLAGSGRWLSRPDVGAFVVRFPHAVAPGDTGWHVDASFSPGDGPEAPGLDTDYRHWRVNVVSRGRALLMLFLYSDVGPDDAPTRISVGSHFDVAQILASAGDDGMTVAEIARRATSSVASRPTALATGDAGDVYLCHPFLLHAAQPVRSGRPRLVSQPPLVPRDQLVLDRPDGDYSPVERAIRLGLGRSA